MMRRIIMTIAALLMAGGTMAQSTIEQFAKALADKGGKIECISCRFEQERQMQLLARAVKKQGTFHYLRPDQLLLAFDDGDYICMTPTHFQLQNGGVKQRVKVQSNPMLRELNRILSACMTGDVEALSAGFTPRVLQIEEGYEVRLEPSRGRMVGRMKSITMQFDGTTMSLTSLRMEEPTGDYMAYRFFDKRFNEGVDAELFNRE